METFVILRDDQNFSYVTASNLNEALVGIEGAVGGFSLQRLDKAAALVALTRELPESHVRAVGG